METSVDNLWKEYNQIKDKLSEIKEVSLISDYTNTMRKVLLLSCGSYFELEMTDMLKRFVGEITNDNERITTFLEKQAIKQKYHTLFDWGEQDKPEKPKKSINQFLRLFGNDFLKKVNSFIEQNENIDKSKNAFLELGHIRNILVHNDFAAYSYEQKTPEDIYTLYQAACKFIPFIEQELKNAT